jgi:outer membrane protein OmpA-like peptidoglycan-associated protein
MKLELAWNGTAAALLAVLLVAAGASTLAAQQSGNPQTPEEWERRLSAPPGPPGFRSLVDRGIEVAPGRAGAAPTVELYLNFAYDSAELDADSVRTLQSLGAALEGDKLKGARLQIIGHTDAKGSEEYNQALSERRAAAVKAFLLSLGSIDPGRLEASGRGKRELKDPAAPLDGINRRVEIRNVSAHATQ